MRNEKLIELLESLHPLPVEFKKALRKELELVFYPAEHFLVNANSTAQAAYFLVSGFAVSYFFDNLKRSVTEFWRPGSIILSPQSFLTPGKTQDAIQLTADSELLMISCESAQKLLKGFPVMGLLTRSVLAQYYLRAQGRMIDMHRLTAWQRHAKLKEEYPDLEQNVSQELIASYLTITPQSLSRIKRSKPPDPISPGIA